MIKIATVCSGIGSPEYALNQLDIEHEIVFACEIDKYARQTYLANYKPNMMFEDMTKPDILEHYSDIFIGGIPCQSFSLAGKRLGELDPRGLLFYNFYEYVKVQRPKYFIIENVKGLLSTENVFNTWLELLGQSVNRNYNMFNHDDSLMYNLHWTVLNSKDFGVPQNRERVFIVGIRNDLPNEFMFPVGWRLDKRLKDILEPVVAEKYYLSDKMLQYLNTRKDNFNNGKINFKTEDDIASTITRSSSSIDISDNIIVTPEISYCIDANYSKGTTVEQYLEKGRRQLIFEEPICVAMRGRNLENPSDRTTGATLQQTLEPNSQGITNTITSVQKDNLIVEPKIMQLNTNNNWGDSVKQQDKVYSEDGLMSCIPSARTESKVNVLTNNRIRRLTERECMRLQGFGDKFITPCSSTQTYKQAGNSITTTVIGAILKNLLT